MANTVNSLNVYTYTGRCNHMALRNPMVCIVYVGLNKTEMNLPMGDCNTTNYRKIIIFSSNLRKARSLFLCWEKHLC